MEAKEVRKLMEAYASVYEGYGKKEKKKKMHDCASHVKHEEYGLGDCIKEMHTLDEEGNVTHYDVQFEHGIVENVPASELEVLISEVHEHFVNDEKNAEVIEEKKKIATGSGKKAMPSKKERSKLAKRARAGEDIGKPGKGFKMVAKKAAKQYGSKEAGERVAAAAMFRNEEVETDLFDYLLEYLVAEGYADTNKAALAIMANMSEEWKQSIVEADSVAAMRARAAERRKQRYKGGPGGRDDFRPYTKDDYDNPKPGYGSGASSQAKDA